MLVHGSIVFCRRRKARDTRAIIDERTTTFFYYNLLGQGLSGGRRFRQDVNDGKGIVLASERDGWEHLYLYDSVTGKSEKPNHPRRLGGA
jgi:hypothetical protein